MEILANGDKDNEEELLLSVIIVNYNGRQFLEACLQSLTRKLSCSHEIIIVDNNSSDDSQKFIADNWPEVQLICSPDNLGFAKGNNLGAERAHGKFLLLLNNDTEILQPLQPLLDYFEEHPDTAIVGGRLRNPDGSIQPSVGHDHSSFRLLFTWMLLHNCTWLSNWQIFERRPEFYHNNHQEVDWVSGAFFCIRRSIWQQLSGFDKDIFMYVEDADLCYRSRKRGGKVAFLAVSDTCHFEGGGKKGLSEHALMTTIDSYRHILTKRHGGVVRYLTCSGLALIFTVRAGLYFLVGATRGNSVNLRKAGFYIQGARRLLRS